ncbi:MAG: TIGR03790 family protein [Deltaproteobacteria bacterium]|nr:TIGR03790 family protein [Deltaproteobacteria bacterium]
MSRRALAAVVLIAGLAGCSSDDASTNSTPAPGQDSGTDAVGTDAGGAAGDGATAKDGSQDGPKPEGGAGKDGGGGQGGAPDGGDAATEAEADAPAGPPTVLFPRTSIEASELAILVNDDDPQSVAVADYYQKARGVPPANVIHVKAPLANNWPQADFIAAKVQVDSTVPAGVQAYAISWTKPYLVDCMSVVSAFALGFDTKYCNTKGGCQPTAAVDYYDSDSTHPFTDHQIRPAMMLVGADTDKSKAVIDKGAAADATFPTGDGYFLRTTDTARSVRYPDFQSTVQEWTHADGLTLQYLDNSGGTGSNVIENKSNVLFYLTGLASVPSIDTLQYLPGAVADHLTSYGGQVPTSGQMSIAKWLEAGATASFGTVVEPCNYQQKFPVASKLLHHYFRGETILEAYWKSVHWPGEGNFAGEPLAKPWGSKASFAADTLTIETTILRPNVTYELRSAPAATGPWTVVVAGIVVTQYQFKTITHQPATAAFYKLVEAGQP